MQIINLFGGPGCGKSTAAAGLFYAMKKAQLDVELVTEYAKDATWEKRYNLLDDQIYIFAKQQRRIARLVGSGIKWVITDSPIPLGLVYLKPDVLSQNFGNLVMEVFNNYQNHNFLLKRRWQYNPIGRNQSLEEIDAVDQKVKNIMEEYHIDFETIEGGETAVDYIMSTVVAEVL